MEDTLLDLDVSLEIEDKQIFKIFTLAILSVVLLVSCFFLATKNVPYFYIPFIFSAFFTVTGLVSISKLTPKNNKVYIKNESKLIFVKFLLWIPLLIIVGILLIALAMLVIIGTGGFGR
jgi:archaellum biogenesis protein FlaJ (TadC family)